MRRKKHIPLFLRGLAVGTALLLFFSMDTGERFTAKGPLTPGHEGLDCGACHQPAPGSLRQQAQAGFRHLVGMREEAEYLVSRPVQMEACQRCHERPEDRHPVHRFLEPRFAEAREAIHPENCLSCHREHQGERVRLDAVGQGYCMHCHKDTEVANDPLDVPHRDLIAQDRWETCLQCHDFHGNHRWQVPARMREAIPVEAVKAYLRDAASPYGQKTLTAPDTLPQQDPPR